MSQNNITNDRMEAFISTIAKQAAVVMQERADDMLRAWQENIEEAQNNEGKFPVLKLSLSASVDLESARIETSLTFSTRYKCTVSAQLPDPSQPTLFEA